MPTRIFRFGKMADAQVIAMFATVRAQHGCQSGSFGIGSGISVQFDDDETIRLLSQGSGGAIDAGDLTIDSRKFTLHFRRGITSDHNIDREREPSPYFDSVGISPGTETAPGAEELIKFIQHIEAQLVRPLFNDGAPGEAADLLQAQLTRLSGLYEGMIRGIDDQRGALDAEHRERMKQLADAEAVYRAACDQEKAQHAEELAAERDALARREEILDNRDHIHARRGLREAITKDIQNRLEQAIVPTRTQWMRWGVFALALIASVALGIFAWLSLSEFATLASAAALQATGTAILDSADALNAQLMREGEGWVLLGRGVLSTFGALGFVAYAIGWLRRVYYDDVRVQRELERYSIDLNRASWAIETIMEAKRAGDVAIPEAVIVGVTKNLFDAPDAREGVTQSDALAALLRSTARAKLGPAGAEFELNGRGAKKLASELKE